MTLWGLLKKQILPTYPQGQPSLCSRALQSADTVAKVGCGKKYRSDLGAGEEQIAEGKGELDLY